MNPTTKQWLLIAVWLPMVLAGHAQQPNMLSEAERLDGWQLLFDGQTTRGWHSYNQSSVSEGWEAENGTLHCKKHTNKSAWNDDILTDDTYTEFDLKLDYKIARGANSGVLFHIREIILQGAESSGPEIQLIDNTNKEASNPLWHMGSLGGLIAADPNVATPTDVWNHLEIYARSGLFKIIQNGTTVVSFVVTAASWSQLIANSQFANLRGFGSYYRGAFGLQNGENEAWFKNIRVKSFSRPPGTPAAAAAISNPLPARAQSQYTRPASTIHTVPADLPPTGTFDQRHLPVSAIEDWEKGVQAAAAGQYSESMDDFERSAVQGNADAAFEIGNYAATSAFFQQDPQMAAKWLRFAIKNGNMIAAHSLSTMIYQGRIPDARENWFSLDTASANSGSAESAYELYLCYRDGVGVTKDDVQASRWKARMIALKQLANVIVSTDEMKTEVASMIDGIVGKIENVLITADPSLRNDKTPAHRIVSIVVTKFNGHLTRTKTGMIDRTQPFEIEFLVGSDPLFMDWNFRVNNVFVDGKAQLVISRMSWPQQLYYSQIAPQAERQLGPESTIGIHELQQ